MYTEDRYYSNKDSDFYTKWVNSYAENKKMKNRSDDYTSISKDIRKNNKNKKNHIQSLSDFDDNFDSDKKCNNKCDKKQDVCECPWEDKCSFDEDYTSNFKCKCNQKCESDCKNQKQIRELLKFIFISLFDVTKNIEKIQKAFCILVKLILKDDCTGKRTKSTIKAIQNDLIALEFVAKKTLKDLNCLKDEIL
ncbi:hypothetical protein [uncultured Clostridium sp.]|uniref:hypothetical protein n=1 Tax=uncultured Clostridium sp. TaxID=59620 RepID=UPI0025F33EC9|nr:hypothetical protein [uncultured Clostridium sp.]